MYKLHQINNDTPSSGHIMYSEMHTYEIHKIFSGSVSGIFKEGKCLPINNSYRFFYGDEEATPVQP